MNSQAVGILFTVNADGKIEPHAKGAMASFSFLFAVLQRKYAKYLTTSVDESYNNVYNYFALIENPELFSVTVYSPLPHCTNTIDVYFIVMAPDMYLAEKSMKAMLNTKSNINSREILLDSTVDLTDNLLFGEAYLKHKLFYFKITKDNNIGIIKKQLSKYITGDNITPICKD